MAEGIRGESQYPVTMQQHVQHPTRERREIWKERNGKRSSVAARRI
jgi:hypothetical protein